MPHPKLSAPHLLLVLGVVAIWGSNFAVMKPALNELPPLLFATLRFMLVCLPGMFFLARPAVPLRNMASYGLLVGAQFALVYVAVHGHISPGLASLVVQAQVFFTIGLAMYWSHERLRGFQWIALLLAALGLGVIAAHTDGRTTLLGVALVLLAALSWAGANFTAKQIGAVNLLAYVVWSGAFAVPPLLALSLLFEGPRAIQSALQNATAGAWAAAVWQAWANTLFGYTAWASLLARYPASTISPFALLVPVFGMGASAWWLNEPLPAWELGAAALVMTGLALNLLWPLRACARSL
jgi:O-acetylserine/cysteine efflux transporter